MRILMTVLLLLATTATSGPDSPQKVVDRAIEHAGGWQAWTGTRSVQFRKTIVRFAADGKVSDTRVQFHRYLLHPSPRMRVEFEDKGSKVVYINDGSQAWKFVNGKPATSQDEVNSARNNTFGSHYVFGMPFKLKDPGVELADAGSEQLPTGQRVRKVRASYPRGVGDAGGLHTWTYYFDEETGRLVANHLLYAAGKYDYTEYYDEQQIGSMKLSTRRLGYNGDAKGRIGPKQSEITYDQIAVNVNLSPSLFSAP